ncbi:hypothetical protein WMY93_000215 [Mugilogobius chulae]|uniref:C2H2-type domain-containing protein n=1 Tax=Mugilogobius chulae TaxID=88201 RepID=A0AAW0Q9C8_9GOBI
MSKNQTLRALVNERLTAAADEIFALFEKTIAEYEKELCFYKEQKQKDQELLDSVLNSKVVLLNVDSVHNGLNQEMITEIKKEPEELSINHESEEQLLELPSACVKKEESPSSPLQSEETQAEDSLETHLPHPNPEEDSGRASDHNEEDCGAPFSWSDIEMETGGELDKDLVYGDHCYQVRIRETSPVRSNLGVYSGINVAARNEDLPGTAAGTTLKRFPCFVCKKRFNTKQAIQRHELIHMGEKPFSCPFCETAFTQKTHLQSHMRIHTGDKPFNCPTCKKAFAHKGNMQVHMRLHTGEKPFACSACGKEFADSSSRKKHLKTHAKKAMRMNRLKALML